MSKQWTPERLGRALYEQVMQSKELGTYCLKCELFSECGEVGAGENYMCGDFAEMLRLLQQPDVQGG